VQYKENKKTGCEAEIEVEISQEEFKKYWDKFLQQGMAEVEIKGFRKGQGPEDILKKSVDHNKVFESAAEEAIKKSLKEITEEKEWTLIDSPVIDFKEVKEGLSFLAKLTFLPEIELKDYKEIIKEVNKKSKEDLEKVAVEDKEVDQAVEWLLKTRKENEGKEKVELTDEIAKTLGDFKTAEDLKKSVKEGIKAEKIVREADKARAKMVDELLKKTKVDVPEVMAKKMADNMKMDLKGSLEGGKMSYEEFVKKHHESEEKLEKKLREQAEKEIKAHLVLDAIIKEEGLEVKNEEVEEEANKILARVPEQEKKNTDLERIYNYSYGRVKNEKVFKFLESII